jgi:hypothetical protein
MGKTYAVSDIHGVMDLWRQISEYCGPDDTIYFLGDASDRGPQCWTTLMAIYNDPRVRFIKGNHEDMLVKAIQQERSDLPWRDDIQLLYHNGGERTLEGFLAMSKEEQDKWYATLVQLPTRLDYVNTSGQKIALTHAGFDPWQDEEWRDYIWDRDHISSHWSYPEDEKCEGDETDTLDFIVHGHTPFEYLYTWHYRGYDVISQAQSADVRLTPDDPIHAVRYCGGKKIDIDCGAFFTGETLLLDLDTFEEVHFKTDLTQEEDED